MGDGINDAPAIKEADVGISVDTAADTAKDAASIVLLQNSLKGIVIWNKRRSKNFYKHFEVYICCNKCKFWKYVLNGRWKSFLKVFATIAKANSTYKFIYRLPFFANCFRLCRRRLVKESCKMEYEIYQKIYDSILNNIFSFWLCNIFCFAFYF